MFIKYRCKCNTKEITTNLSMKRFFFLECTFFLNECWIYKDSGTKPRAEDIKAGENDCFAFYLFLDLIYY